jgi:phosphoglycerate dehydrogenase-like enzyme
MPSIPLHSSVPVRSAHHDKAGVLRPSVLFVLNPVSAEQIYGREAMEEIAVHADLLTLEPLTPEEALARPDLLARAEAIFSGWGGPRMDRAFLEAAPKLEAVFYGAGSVRSITPPEFWERGIVITSAVAANAIPVAEYTLACTIFGLKRLLPYARGQRKGDPWWGERPAPGAYGSTVGLVSMGIIGRLVREKLRQLDVRVLAYDPFLKEEEADQLGVELTGLEGLFARSDVVSLHTPWLPETENLIRGRHFEKLKPGAAFINTSRGAVVHEEEMIEALRIRSDVQAFLDVAHPEPPLPDSPLRQLPNVMLTPHLAGSHGPECRRMGRWMVEEFHRWRRGEALKHALTRERAAKMG